MDCTLVFRVLVFKMILEYFLSKKNIMFCLNVFSEINTVYIENFQQNVDAI